MNKPPFQITLGVDIAKMKFDAASLIEGKYKHKHFTNDLSGYADFVIWFMTLCGSIKPLIRMEETEAIAFRLRNFCSIKVLLSALSILPKFMLSARAS